MKKKFYTSDTHFGHRNVIKYCNRRNRQGKIFDLTPSGVDEMDEMMIENWNSVVAPDDDVYHNGDFSMSKHAPSKILPRLNGNIHLIWGNHDSPQVRSLDLWASSQPFLEIKDQGKHIVLCHYALRVWNRSHHGSLMLYGHSHGSLPGNSQSLDVGVDCWDMTPVTLDQILERMETLPAYIGEDHH